MHQRPLLWFRSPYRRRSPYRGVLFSFILAFAMILGFFTYVNFQIRPILKAMAITKISNAVTTTINRAITEGISADQISYDDIVSVEKDDTGRVTALKSNMSQVNLLRSELLSLVLDEVSALSVEDFSIPIGNLTSIDFLSGLGPGISVRVLSVGAANAKFEHEFTDAGVNQTLHQIMLDIEVTVQILLPGETVEAVVSTQVCVAETVIVGQVPDTYLQLENGRS